ncbi:uncharacterized protein TNCT_617461 [Trichonephila clavata]|uniref:Uncharacterized protein n=1 Tax=Trichonephila clavata TaxID=2740835 RepID=A0A8X6M2U2_TRICU|nr:uncharacterized protein TNCT_617461 [Trichonephila clavata]
MFSFWNFKKSNWGSYKSSSDNSLSEAVSFCDLDSKWWFFKDSVLRAACVANPIGNRKKYKPFIHNSEVFLPLLLQRTALQRHFMSSSSPDAKSVLNMINAKIKRLYLVIRRESLNSLCESLGSRTPNTKLWKLVKNIHRVWPQVEKTNTLSHSGGSLCCDNEAANLLGRHYQKESRLSFNSKDKLIAKLARDFIHKSHCSPGERNSFFNKDFTMIDLESACQERDFKKFPGMDGIDGQMLVNLNQLGRSFPLDIFSTS